MSTPFFDDRLSMVMPGSQRPSNVPHRLTGQTMLAGQPVRRRVEVRYRKTGVYIISTCTQDDGLFDFRHLPTQTLATPYILTCFDDAAEQAGNALVFDRVYQVDDNGLPPQT